MYKSLIKALTGLLLILSLHATGLCQNETSAENYTGRWSLYLPDGAGYLKVHEDQGFLDAELLWYGGSINPVAGLYLTDHSLVVTRISGVTRKRDASGKPERMHQLTDRFKFSPVSQNELKGVALLVNKNGKGIQRIEFTAKKNPPLPPRPDLNSIRYGEPVILFGGKDLNKWTLADPGDRSPFQLIDGIMVNQPVEGEGSLGKFRTVEEFEDFKLTLDFNYPGDCNSGIYLRGVYEIQMKYNYGKDPNLKSTGALYGRIVPSQAAEKPAGEWQDIEIILYKRHVTVTLNGSRIIDNQPVEGITGGALSANEFAPGPIYLQGNHSRGVSYRNIILTPILN